MDECSYYVNVPILMLTYICVVSRFRLLCFDEYSNTYLVGVKLLNYTVRVCSSLPDNVQWFAKVVVKCTHNRVVPCLYQHVVLLYFFIAVSLMGVCWSHFCFCFDN